METKKRVIFTSMFISCPIEATLDEQGRCELSLMTKPTITTVSPIVTGKDEEMIGKEEAEQLSLAACQSLARALYNAMKSQGEGKIERVEANAPKANA